MHGLTKKWHGLPVWAWAAIASVVLFGVYYLYKKRASGSSSASAGAPTDAGDSSGLDSGDSGDSGSGGTLSTPDNTQLPANNPFPDIIVPGLQTDLTPSLVGAVPGSVSTGFDSRAGIGTGGATNTPVPNKKASISPLVPLTATATSLQTTVAKANAKDIFPKTTAANHPAAVKVSANKTGASANKKQGVFSIH